MGRTITGRRVCGDGCAESLEGRRLLAAGALDPSFGNLGSVQAQFSALQSFAFALTLDRDGKALIFGEQAGVSDAAAAQFPLMRFNADGTLDSSFGNGGRALPNPVPARRLSVVSDIEVLPDGKILAVGTPSGNARPLAIARYLSDGTPDLSFGMSGVVFPDEGTFLLGPQMAVQDDGKIVVGVWASAVFTVIRLNADGSPDDGSALDTTPGDRFSTAGVFAPGLEGFVQDIELQGDGKIIAAGWVNDLAAEFRPRMTVVRLNADGTPDASFNEDGIATLLPPPGFASKHDGYAYDVALRPDGRILVGGIQQPVEGFTIKPGSFVVYSLNADGSTDTTFGGVGAGGRVSTSFAADLPQVHQSGIYSMVLRPDGVLIAAGYVSAFENGVLTDYAAIAAYATNGTLVGTFGTNGKVVSTAGRLIQGVALDADYRLVTLADGVFPNMVVARYFTNSPPVVPELSLSVDEDAVLSADVTASDLDGDALSFEVTSPPLHGSLTFNADGTFSYTPAANFSGSDSFAFAASDWAVSVGGIVQISVEAINDPPAAVGRSMSVLEDAKACFSLDGNDLETAAGDLIFTISSVPAHGVLRVGSRRVRPGDQFTGPPSLVYEPALTSEATSDGFTFTVTDAGDGAESGALTTTPATVQIAIHRYDGVSLSDGILRIGLTPGDDNVSADHNRIHLHKQKISLSGVREIRIWARGGDDQINLQALRVPAFVHAGAGNDRVRGTAADDTVFGGVGDDHIDGRQGGDLLMADAGGDALDGEGGANVLASETVVAWFTRADLATLNAFWSDRQIDADESAAAAAFFLDDGQADVLKRSSDADWLVFSPDKAKKEHK